MNEISHAKITPQSDGAHIGKMLAKNAARITVREIKRKQTKSPHDADRDQIIQRPARIEHHDQLSPWLQNSAQFALSCPNIGHMVQNTMTKHDVEAVILIRNLQDASLLD